MMRVLDLFSGIGGFSLGLERAGMRTVAFCEIDPFARRVLRKHWAEVPIYEDIRTLTADTLRRDGIAVDVICGGFPCQDISLAGKGAGLAGERSGLWREFARLIGELVPRYVIVENVAALLGRGLDAVLADMAALGFDAEWHCIPAATVGAPHRRDRVWVVAYPQDRRWHEQSIAVSGEHQGQWPGEIGGCRSAPAMANTEIDGREPWRACHSAEGSTGRQSNGGARGQDMANANGHHQHGRPGHVQVGRLPFEEEAGGHGHASRAVWPTEPDVGRVAHGVPARVDRLRGLGNAVVPQIPELIGRAILAAEARA